MTRICIFGAGAIGGYLAAALDNAGAAVSLVARGPHLEAILKNGLTFEKDGVTSTHHLPASRDPANLGPQAGRVPLRGATGEDCLATAGRERLPTSELHCSLAHRGEERRVALRGARQAPHHQSQTLQWWNGSPLAPHLLAAGFVSLSNSSYSKSC